MDGGQGNPFSLDTFRRIYGTLLTDWLQARDIKPILGANYPKMGLLG